MNNGLESVICQALANAKASGRDQWAQIEEAVQMIQLVRCDLTRSEALAAVDSFEH